MHKLIHMQKHVHVHTCEYGPPCLNIDADTEKQLRKKGVLRVLIKRCNSVRSVVQGDEDKDEDSMVSIQKG
jgi:hypothetical protein